MNKEKIQTIKLKSTGMEFASEMIIKAKLNNLKIKEIPINFYKDKRKHKSNLKTIRDGFRHLKLILQMQQLEVYKRKNIESPLKYIMQSETKYILRVILWQISSFKKG